MSFVFLAGAILSEVIGTLALRVASEGRKAAYLGVVMAYPISLFLLVRTLEAGMGIGVAYGVWAATGVVLTAVASRFLFKETITGRMACGMALIAAGVFLIELG